MTHTDDTPRRVTLTAQVLAADTKARTIAGRLVPFGEVGHTSIGPTVFLPGSIEAPNPADPAGPSFLNLEHENTRRIGRLVSAALDADGLNVVFRLFDTHAATDALIEAAEGARAGLSVEADVYASRITAAGVTEITAAAARHAALCVSPAFTGAQVSTVTANTTDEKETPTMTDTDTLEATMSPDDIAQALEHPADTLTVNPAPVRASRTAPKPGGGMPLRAMLSGLADPATRNQVLASLADITYGGVGGDIAQPQWVGELWSGVAYQRRLVPLLNGPKELTGLKIQGWRWKVAPKGGEYAGNKAPIPTNNAATEPQESQARRWAGGHNFDRALVDFDSRGFWDSYFESMAADYAAWSDLVVAEELTAVATDAGNHADGVAAIVGAALTVAAGGGIATTFSLAPDVFAGLLELTSDSVPAWLAGAITLNPLEGEAGGVTFAPVLGQEPGTVVALDPRAATYHELGGTPIRADAPNIALGGVDVGMYGYAGVDVHRAAAIAVATVGA